MTLAIFPVKRKIKIIHDIGGRAKELVSQLLAFGRKQVFTVKELNLNAILDSQKSFLDRVVPENVKIEIHKSKSSPNFMGNQTQVQQVIMNLVVNSRDAIEKNGSLIIRTGKYVAKEGNLAVPKMELGQYAYLEVTDTGTGISKDIIEQIFNPFFTTKEVGKGTGLGLSVAHGIVKQHNGYITVSSRLGKGSTFKVFFAAKESSPKGK